MSEWNVGDVAVCIDNSRQANLGRNCPIHDRQLERIKVGKLYRVEMIDEGGDFTQLSGLKYPTHLNYGAWGSYRFRKLPKASDEFTQQMLALKPKKARQPA